MVASKAINGGLLLGANFDATLNEVQAFLAAEEAQKPSAANA
jgi:hypothetical protein